MKNLKYIFIFSLLVLVLGAGFVFAITALTPAQVEQIVKESGSKHTLADYGLSAEAVKYLTPAQIKEILSSKTPEETVAAERERIETSGTAEEKAALKAALENPQTGGAPSGTVNCFDYYHFGSIQTQFTAQKYDVKQGDTIEFKGPINNQNDYPIVDGLLYIKVFRTRSTTKDANGPDVVDQFIVKDNLTIPAKGSIPVSFSWKVPESLTEGDYRIASFFMVQKKFNLLGLSFTNDVIGNAFNFRVVEKTPNTKNVQFDTAGVTINDKPYFFAAYPPRVESKTPAVVSAKIINSTNKDETVDITWNLYSWDSIHPDNFIRKVSEKVTIKANSSKNVQITINENTEPVYYLVGELKYKDSKSILDIRFVRPENNRLRINFPSVTSFPIQKGVSSTIFSCLYNSGTSDVVENGKLVLELTDSIGKKITDYIYEGAVTGNMMAVKKDFTPKKNYDHFFLTAQLWQGNKLTDQAKFEYDCNKIDPNLCSKKSNLLLYILLVVVALILIIIVVVIFVKRKSKT